MKTPTIEVVWRSTVQEHKITLNPGTMQIGEYCRDADGPRGITTQYAGRLFWSMAPPLRPEELAEWNAWLAKGSVYELVAKQLPTKAERARAEVIEDGDGD